MHDLIREHARALADRFDPNDDRDQAVERLLDYYQHTAARADALLTDQDRTASTPTASTIPTAVPVLTSREQALAWARAERTSLLACLNQVTAAGQHVRVIALTAGLAGLLGRDGPWVEAITRQATAVQAARQLGDRPGQAGALTDLGNVRHLSGDYRGAARDLEEALGILRDLGGRLGQARALTELGDARLAIGHYPGAARDLEEALDIFRDLGDRLGRANALTWLGTLRRLGTEDYPGAARDLEEALSIFRDLGDRLGQARALTYLGRVRSGIGDCPGAVRDLEEGLAIHRDLGHRLGQANALTYLGRLRRLTGNLTAAARDLQEAAGTYHDIGSLHGEVTIFNESGTLSRTRGDLRQARSCHQRALDLARQIDSAWDEAEALVGLARCARDADRGTEAEAGLREALAIFQRIGAAEAADVSAELGALPSASDSALPPISRWTRPPSHRSSRCNDTDCFIRLIRHALTWCASLSMWGPARHEPYVAGIRAAGRAGAQVILAGPAHRSRCLAPGRR